MHAVDLKVSLEAERVCNSVVSEGCEELDADWRQRHYEQCVENSCEAGSVSAACHFLADLARQCALRNATFTPANDAQQLCAHVCY